MTKAGVELTKNMATRAIQLATVHALTQRGLTTGPRNNFAQFKSCRSQAAATLYNKAWRADGTESRVETDSK